MQKINELIKEKAKYLLENDIVDYILGYKTELNNFDSSPYLFNKDTINDLIYNAFCGMNLSKTLFLQGKDKKIGVFLKPCDTYSFYNLLKENKLNKNNIYVVGVECNGKLNFDKIKSKVNDLILSIEEDYDNIYVKTLNGTITLKYDEELFLDKCLYCKTTKHKIYDELLIVNQKELIRLDSFKNIEDIENLSPDERFKFWQNEFSRCIRCNTCRNVCPACTCNTCIFDNPKSKIDNKVNITCFEEKLYHIIKSFHVLGRCTDCGECSRVCPQRIPLHLLNRKYIKDIEEFYGDYSDKDNFPLSEFNLNDKEI